MLTEDYRVQLDAFDGPMDLLLYLIRKNEVDVHDIPIAAITEQYLKFLEQIEQPRGSEDRNVPHGRIDIDAAGEFLVLAATLMEIKSRMLSPKPLAESPDAPVKPTEDPRAELVQQLLAYKKFRDAADALENRALEWSRRFPTHAAGTDSEKLREAIESIEEETEIEDLHLLDLVEAFKRISETVNFDRLGEHEVKYDDTPVEIHAEDIVDRLRRRLSGEREDDDAGDEKLELRRLFKGRTRSEMVGLFLALLQLVRQQRVAIRSAPEKGEILLALREEQQASGESPASN